MPIVLKSGNINLLEAPGAVEVCNGIALAFYLLLHENRGVYVKNFGLRNVNFLEYFPNLKRTQFLTVINLLAPEFFF